MDIAALSISLNQSSLQQAVSIRVLDIANTQAAQQGQDLAQMLSSVQPNLGQNLDIKV